jgi:hypothetical protein
MIGEGEEERGWDFEIIDYEPDGERPVVVINSAPALDGKKFCTRDALLGWTTHRVTVPDADGETPYVDAGCVPELLEELTERAALFVEKFDEQSLARRKAQLVVDAGVEVRREIEAQTFGLHTAVQIVAKNFGGHHGLVTGLPRTDGRGRNIYEVMYWYGQSGDGARQPFHARDLVALVRPYESPSISIR